MCFQPGTSPPHGSVGCSTCPFRVCFHLFVSPPRRAGSLRKGIDVGFSCPRACVLHLAFLRLAPPPRGRILTGVCLAISPFLSRPPHHTGGTRQVLTGGLPFSSVCVSFNYFASPFSWLYSQAVKRCGYGFFGAASSTHGLVEPGLPELSIFLRMRLIRVGS